MTQSIMGRLTSLITQSAPPHADTELTPSTHLVNDLGFDSIGLLTLALLMEEAFGLEIASHADEYRAIERVGDIVHFIEAHGAA